MGSIGDIWYAIRGEGKQLQVDAKKAGDEAGKTIGQRIQAGIKASPLKQGILQGLGMGGGLAAANLISTAVSGVVSVIGDAVNAASAMNESLGKTRVVFADNAAEIEAWSKTSAESFGLSQQAALEAAGTYGNLFQAFGIGRDEATKMSKTLVELAADLASFNNTSIEDALIALRSGLSGETEPLKRYGIAISDARMRTELMAQGVKNLGTVLTPLQKSQAAYGLILKDSTLAQGDFARTADGLANSQRTLDAELANLSAELGANLLPIVRDITVGIVDLIHGVKALGAAVEDTLEPIGGLGEVLKVLPFASTAVTTQALIDKFKETGRVVNLMAGDVGGASKVTSKAITTIAVASEKTADRVDTSLGDIVASLKKRTAEMLALSDDAGEAIYGEIDRRATVSRINAEKAEIQKNIRVEKLRGQDLADAKQKLRDLSREQLDAISDLVAHGEVKQKELDSTVRSLIASLHGATAAEEEAILRLIAAMGRAVPLAQRLADSVGTSTGGRVQHRAAGGPVYAGGTFQVGEKGPETLHMFPGGGGFVDSHGAESSVRASGVARVLLGLDAQTAALFKRLGYDEQAIGQKLADASGFVTNLHQLTAMR